MAALTVPNLNVAEGCLRARVRHEDLTVEGEDDGVLCEVNHAADDIARLPGAPKWLTAQVPALALHGEPQEPMMRDIQGNGDKGQACAVCHTASRSVHVRQERVTHGTLHLPHTCTRDPDITFTNLNPTQSLLHVGCPLPAAVPVTGAHRPARGQCRGRNRNKQRHRKR